MKGLQQARDIAADILQGIVDGVVVADGSGSVIIWNRAAEEMTGIAANDALGSRVAEVLAENPALVSQIEKTLASGRSYSDYEATLAVRHGPPLPAACVTTVLLDREGAPQGVILTIRDQSGVRDLKE